MKWNQIHLFSERYGLALGLKLILVCGFVCLSDSEKQENIQTNTDIFAVLFTAGESSLFRRYAPFSSPLTIPTIALLLCYWIR